jgi:hypothetical protein
MGIFIEDIGDIRKIIIFNLKSLKDKYIISRDNPEIV